MQRYRLLQQLSDTWLPDTDKMSPLAERLPPLERKASQCVHVLAQAAAAPMASADSIMAVVIRETRVKSASTAGSRDTTTPASGTDDPRVEALSDEALSKVKISQPFRQAALDLATHDLTTLAGRRDALGCLLNRDTSIVLRLMCKPEASVSRSHPALTTALGLRASLPEFLGFCQAVNRVTGQVPESCESWVYSAIDGPEAAQMSLLLQFKLVDMDCYNPPYGCYALKSLACLRTGQLDPVGSSLAGKGKGKAKQSTPFSSKAQFRIVKRVDFYCNATLLRDWKDFIERTLTGLGVPAQLPPAEDAVGFTIATWVDFYLEYLDCAFKLPSELDQLNWLREGSIQFQAFLRKAQSELRRVVLGPDQGVIGALMARDAPPATFLVKKIKALDSVLAAGAVFTLVRQDGGGSQPDGVNPCVLPLISELEANLSSKKRPPGWEDVDEAKKPRQLEGLGDAQAPGSMTHLWMWLTKHKLLAFGSRAWKVDEIARAYNVRVEDICWAVAISNKLRKNLMSLCDLHNTDHRHATIDSPAHAQLDGFDSTDSATITKFARDLTLEEKSRLQAQIHAHEPPTSGRGKGGKGGRGKGKGGGKGRGKGGRGRPHFRQSA